MIRVETVREGARLLAEILKSADGANDDNGQVAREEMKKILDTEGYTKGTIVEAPLSLLRYAYRVGGSRVDPSLDTIDKAANKAIRAVEKAAAKTGDLEGLGGKEYKKLAPTFKNVVRFAIAYKGQEIDALFF